MEEKLLGDEVIYIGGEGTVEPSLGKYAPSASETFSQRVDQNYPVLGVIRKTNPCLETWAQPRRVGWIEMGRPEVPDQHSRGLIF